MKINDRLKTIGDLADANSFCLDVGCDHAFLDIYLVKRGDNINAVASDIAEGPLDQARKNIKAEKLDEKIEVRLGNGLDTYSSEVDTVIISGMGGRNMIGIFKNNLKVLRLRFGLDDGQCRTLEEVGQIFGVTRERIRQIEAKALRKLRHPSRSRKLKDFLTD